MIFGLASCGSGKPKIKEIEQVPVVPVTATINVDGEPAEGVRVTFNPLGESSAEKMRHTISGITDEEGHPKLQMIFGGEEGVPPGEYYLTFLWLDTSKVTMGRKDPGQEKRNDKLHGRYLEEGRNTPHVKVIEDTPLDLGTINLKSK